jgi:hypothetical protein
MKAALFALIFSNSNTSFACPATAMGNYAFSHGLTCRVVDKDVVNGFAVKRPKY